MVNPPDLNRNEKWRQRLWKKVRPFRSLAWLLLLFPLNVLWLGLMPAPQAAKPDRVCPSPAESSPQPALAEERTPVPLILEKPEGVVVNFWRERWPHDKTIYLQTAKKTPPKGQSGYAVLGSDTALTVSQRPLERQESDGNIGANQYAAEAEVTARKEVALTVCLDATKADVDPGTYLGSLRISGRAIQPVTVPVKMTFQYPGYHWIVPLIADIAFLAGSFVVWASGKKAALASDKNPQRRLWRSLGELPGWIADNYVGVVAGAIAAISVFLAKYWRAPAWGAQAPEDWLALLGVIFSAYTAALTATSALVPSRRK